MSTYGKNYEKHVKQHNEYEQKKMEALRSVNFHKAEWLRQWEEYKKYSKLSNIEWGYVKAYWKRYDEKHGL